MPASRGIRITGRSSGTCRRPVRVRADRESQLSASRGAARGWRTGSSRLGDSRQPSWCRREPPGLSTRRRASPRTPAPRQPSPANNAADRFRPPNPSAKGVQPAVAALESAGAAASARSTGALSSARGRQRHTAARGGARRARLEQRRRRLLRGLLVDRGGGRGRPAAARGGPAPRRQ